MSNPIVRRTRVTGTIGKLAAFAMVAACFGPGCSSSDSNTLPANNTGGSDSRGGSTSGGNNAGGTTGGTATGGTSNSGGTSNPTGGTSNPTGGTSNPTGGTSNPTGGTSNPTGGTSNPTGGTSNPTGGTSGDTGGTSGDTGGTTATGGTGGVSCDPVLSCGTGTKPASANIADFAPADGGVKPGAFGVWADSVYGGTYVYPTPAPTTTPACPDTANHDAPLTEDFSGGNWHISGNVGAYSGMGLWWSCKTGGTTDAPAYATVCPIDASSYTGIEFIVSGNAGPASGDAGSGAIRVMVSTPSTTAQGSATCGTCVADADAGVKCEPTAVEVPVSSTPTVVSLTWAQLGVSSPELITSIAFALKDPHTYPWSADAGTDMDASSPYALDITIDDIKFTGG